MNMSKGTSSCERRLIRKLLLPVILCLGSGTVQALIAQTPIRPPEAAGNTLPGAICGSRPHNRLGKVERARGRAPGH